jgi:hypothetical protein
MNDCHGDQTNNSPQYNDNPHYEIQGDLVINEYHGYTFNEMCIGAIALALIALILAFVMRIISNV